MTSTCDLQIVGKYVEETNSVTIEVVVALAIALLFTYMCIYLARFIRLNKILSFVLLGDEK